jgi:adenylate kinase
MLVITGVQGVGKSHLADLASQRGFIAEKMDLYNIGDEIVKNAGGYKPLTKDDIKTAPQDKVSTWLAFTLGLLAGRARIRPLLVTAHIPYERNGWLVSEEDYRGIRPAGYIHVYAEPEQIQALSNQDTTRRRPQRSTREIDSSQRVSLLATESLAVETGARLITVWNRLDNVEENVNKINAVACELFSD